jgi:hypothetical protein
VTTLSEIFRRADVLGESLQKFLAEQGGDDGGWAVPMLVVVVHTYVASGIPRNELYQSIDEAWDLMLGLEHVQKELLRLATIKGPMH